MRLPPVSREASGLLLSVASTLFGTVMSICAKVLGERGVGVFVIIAGSRVVLLAATLCTLAVQRLNPLRSKRWVGGRPCVPCACLASAPQQLLATALQ